MVRRLIIGVVLASVAGTAMAGCSGNSSSTALSPAAVWAGKVCSTSAGIGAGLALPSANPSDPVAEKASLLSFMTGISTRLKTEEANLQKVGPPPVSGGQAMLAKAQSDLSTVQAAVDQAVTSIQAMKTKNPSDFLSSLRSLSSVFVTYQSYEGPVKELARNPSLSSAFAQAPSCKVSATNTP